jgi:hypothetical protein
VLQARERALTPYPSVVFTFGFVVESIKEFGGASSKLTKYVFMIVITLSTKELDI